MNGEFRAKLRKGEQLIGTMISINSTDTVELLSHIGFDWLFIDAEHGTFSASQLKSVISNCGKTPCVVRVVAPEEIPIKKALDVGAEGIIAPQVNTAVTAERVVSYCKYAPEGIRGVGIGRAQGYGLNFEDYINTANESIAVIVQAEHIDAVNHIDSIVKVDGIDGILIGPYDLSASMGLTGQVNHADVVAAIDRVSKACLSAKIPIGIFGVNAEAVRPYLNQGYTFAIAGVDTLLLGHAARKLLAKLKA